MTFAVLYTWMKAVHVASAFVFIAGVSVLSLILVADAPNASHSGPAAARWRRWNRIVVTPAMLLAWVFGLALAMQGHWLGDTWLSAKLALVLLLSGIHGVQSRALRLRAAGRQAGVWRLMPLIVATAILAILGLAVAKPF
jgi:uncharacterized membrane protein